MNDTLAELIVKILGLKDIPNTAPNYAQSRSAQPSLAEQAYETAMIAGVLALEYAPNTNWQHTAVLGLTRELPRVFLGKEQVPLTNLALLEDALTKGLTTISSRTREYLTNLWQEAVYGKTIEAEISRFAAKIQRTSQNFILRAEGYNPKVSQLPEIYLQKNESHGAIFIDKQTPFSGKRINEETALLFYQIASLKNVLRTGWYTRGITLGETVAEHSSVAALLGLIIATELTPELCAENIVSQLLLHDFPNTITGDALPGTTTAQNKRERELKAYALLTKLLSPLAGEKMNLTYQEYDASRITGTKPTQEALFVTSTDRLQTALRAALYEQAGNVKCREFFLEVDKKIPHSVLNKVYHDTRKYLELS
ncbi:MAG: HD domain-containing protein [Candidatus Woesearchaeota archaeon]|nr:HD domain-containing protein [Candidatus Woesearchaeota archaeon]